ncbi:AMIN-like domain-containing (lipo)protein [Actinophytocola xanthii]|uniref:AMIN-like domain-containing protein n=1 Tax=Actinophytocola xanthii TaxID=1912961 RepID=A0A1Q8C1N6_9PSEU|nr:hypothetical protein [Actinophytocola xanthii]OLF08252.1 hypothetical protein BU204_34560 [Actinophytocola xanthii]
MTRFSRRALGALAATVLMLTGGVVAAAPASTAHVAVPVLTNIRTGLHTGFDRVVLDWSGAAAPRVRVTHVGDLYADGSGELVWLTGEFFVQVVASPAYAHRADGSVSYANPQKFRTRALRNVMAVAVVSDFEGYVTVGLGTRYRSWVRTSALTSPARLVVDVGH